MGAERDALVEQRARAMCEDGEVWAMVGVHFKQVAPDDFQFDFEAMLPRATAALKLDSSLQRMRYRLVPSTGLSEEAFWRHYFYHLSLIQDDVMSELALRYQGAIKGENVTVECPKAQVSEVEE